MSFPSSKSHGAFSASNLPQPGVDLGWESIAPEFETKLPTRLPAFHCLIAEQDEDEGGNEQNEDGQEDEDDYDEREDEEVDEQRNEGRRN